MTDNANYSVKDAINSLPYEIDSTWGNSKGVTEKGPHWVTGSWPGE